MPSLTVGEAQIHRVEETTCKFPLAMLTRTRLIANCLQREAMLIPAHFAPPYVGFLRQQNGVVTFEPFAG